MSLRELVILGCSSQQPTRKRNHGAYLFRINEEGLLFDPGEGTQRQFIFADVAPPTVTRMFVSHFHGDHCLGVGSMLMRLNLDKVKHPIHCYFPASGKKYFDRLRYGCIYHETIQVVEHPVKTAGVVDDDGYFRIESTFLQHSTDNVGWRIIEPDTRKFDKEKLKKLGVMGPLVKKLEKDHSITLHGKTISLEDVSWVRKGDAFAVVLDTKPCEEAVAIAQNAKLLLIESTYLDSERHLARKYMHMTAKQAATIAKKAGVEMLVLTHFSARYADLKEFEKEAKAIFPNTFIAQDLKKIHIPR
ncbi:MAG: ribonuclease Z [Parachlamydiales bacterium]|nr:ribonuclease Z [Parachlamydiales bacterium]